MSCKYIEDPVQISEQLGQGLSRRRQNGSAKSTQIAARKLHESAKKMTEAHVC